MTRNLFYFLSFILGACLLAVPESSVALPGKKGDNGAAFFETNIRPILVKHCYECHSEAEDAQKGGLLLDRETGWLEGGDTGKAVISGNLDDSLLFTAIQYKDEDYEMPPKYKLEDGEIELLKSWILRGAPGSAEDMGETKFSRLGDQEAIFGEAQKHWAFQPVKAIEPPRAPVKVWNENPIDQFIYAKFTEKGISYSPPATGKILSRRLAYDLTGLPPESLSDYEKPLDSYIDELSDSPRFGEHFARLWLDVARYADTANTYRPDTKTPHYYPFAFTFRDYVIDAFNSDKPFNQFIREQLAADLMGHKKGDPEIAALGFIGVSPHRGMSADFVDDVIDTTTRGLLGLTVACSRCHDHKFEPIPTADYYSLYGVFNSVNRPVPWAIEAFPLMASYQPDKAQKDDYEKKLAAIDKEIKEVGNKKKKGNNRSVSDLIEQTKLAELLLTHDGAPARAMSISEAKKPVSPVIFIRGEASQKGEKVPRRFLKVIDPEQPAFSEDNSGRLDLAIKIADPKNPLTARVLVNRIWGALMGSYLVETPSDFGLQGAPPSHPELLDWLAADFIENGWSLKHLVRTIVTSRTYQQRSIVREDMAEIDLENEFYHRANLKRLEIEEIRDSLLAVSGVLDSRMRGRSGELWGDEYTKRRSVYGYINRFNLDPTLRAFDFPSPMQSQERRTESIVAPQALFSMNSPFVTDQAAALIDRLEFEKGVTREERIDGIFKAVLHRPADPVERERFGKFVDLEKTRAGVSPWPLVAQALFMSNEFLYVD